MHLIPLAGLVFLMAAPSALAQEAPPVLEATMPLEIVHRRDRPLELGTILLEAGNAERGPAGFRIRYGVSTDDLGKPAWATWRLTLDRRYCRNEPTWVWATVTGPSAQTWRGPRHGVDAGPDRRGPGAVMGFGDAEHYPGLLEAVSESGRFVLALENDLGERWGEVVVDMPDTATRERLYDANRAALARTDPATVPITSGQDRVEYTVPPVAPPPSRRCPTE